MPWSRIEPIRCWEYIAHQDVGDMSVADRRSVNLLSVHRTRLRPEISLTADGPAQMQFTLENKY